MVGEIAVYRKPVIWGVHSVMEGNFHRGRKTLPVAGFVLEKPLGITLDGFCAQIYFSRTYIRSRRVGTRQCRNRVFANALGARSFPARNGRGKRKVGRSGCGGSNRRWNNLCGGANVAREPLAMPDAKHIFRSLCATLLDSGDHDFKEKCAQWGLEQYAQLEKHEKLLNDGNTSDNGYFIYGTAFAVIVGEFGQRAYNNHFSNECEINLVALGLDFRDIAGYVEKDMKADRREQSQQNNCVDLQDVWSTVCEWKKEIHKSLTEIYAAEGKDPDWAIYASLEKLFKPATPSDAGRIVAYEYISNGFSY